MMTSPIESAYQRAAEAAAAADTAAATAHAALFDFARELGDATAPVRRNESPLAVRVHFLRRTPPHFDAPAGVHVEEAPKERPAGFASVVIEARDLFFAIESIPGIAIAAVTNIPAMEAFAASICGVHTAADGKPHLLATTDDGTVIVPTIHAAPLLLDAFLLTVGDVFAARAQFNPLPQAALSA
ncbi:MAG TPA: hypothetical protein VGN14_06280 [Candidatus Elarobacter sp.]|jgi:hypothetical protein